MDWTQTASIPPAANTPEPPGAAAATAAIFGGGPAPGAAAPPDPYSDFEGLATTFKAAYRQCFDKRSVFERIWWRLLLYVLGRQWIYYDRGSGQWLDKRLQKWIPKPVTNKIAETVSAIISVFGSVELTATCKPNGADPKDVQAAEAANRYETPIRIEHDFVDVEIEADFWLATLGNVFLHPWWDVNGDGAVQTIPFERCTACQTVSSPAAIKAAQQMCPSCGGMAFEDAVDVVGQPVGRTFSPGRGRTDVCSPLEIAVPPIYTRFDDTPILTRVRWRPRHYCEQYYPEEVLDTLTWENQSGEHTLQLYRGLAQASDIGSMPGGGLAGGETTSEAEGITEYELWMKPSKDYPKGLVLRALGDGEHATILPLPDQGLPGPLPLETPQGQRVWPWIHIGYELFGGRLWNRSPLEHLIEKQNQLNQIDSLIQLIIQRTANPVWLEPKGAEVKKFTGEPGLVVKYNPLVAGGNAKPERIEGAQVPSSLVRIREMILLDIENLAGTHDIIKGQKPTGVEAFSALQLLVERSQSRYGPVLKNRGKGYQRWFQIALEMERQFGPDDRALSVLGPNGAYIQEHFQRVDLLGSIRVVVEDGSQMPKTSLGKRAAIEQLRTFGVIDPANPDTAYRILQVFGQVDLWPGLDVDVQSALAEQDEFERWAQQVQFAPARTEPIVGPGGAMVMDPMSNQPQVQEIPPQPNVPPPGQIEIWHNHAVHAAEHRKWANGDTLRRLMQDKPEIKPFVTWMIEQHDVMLAMQMAAQAGPQPGAGKDGNGVGGGRALGNSNRESGNPADVPRGQGEGAQNQGPM